MQLARLALLGATCVLLAHSAPADKHTVRLMFGPGVRCLIRAGEETTFGPAMSILDAWEDWPGYTVYPIFRHRPDGEILYAVSIVSD